MEIKKRKKYAIKNLVTDLKKINPTPRILYKFGAELIYTEWNNSTLTRGAEDIITKNLDEVRQFMKSDYERKIVEGDLEHATDTPKSVLEAFMRDRPSEFLNYVLTRHPEYVHNLLTTASEMREIEVEQCKKMEDCIRKQMKGGPDSPEIWNQLRILLWLQGKYKKADDAFQKAKQLGWTPEDSNIVSII